jgi:AcrR family transcriptional regulator
MPENTEAAPRPGRRERKRLETRNSLISAALDLFAERGFDAVTVNDIADRVDVDPSTFFRHFGSKEAVIFSETGDWTGRLGDAIRAEPAELPLLEIMRAAAKHLAALLMIDIDTERRRADLISSSPSVRAQSLAVREGLIDELALAIADRMKVDPTLDSRPFLLAATWLLAANWYRGYSLRTGQLPASVDEAVERISELVEGFVSAAAGGDKSN